MAPLPGPVDDVMLFEILPRRTPWRGASPAVTDVDGVRGPFRCSFGCVPGVDEVLEQAEQPGPCRDPPAADGKRPGCEQRSRRAGIGPRLVPADRIGASFEGASGRFDR